MADERILFKVEADTSQFDNGMNRAIASLQNFNNALKGMRDFKVPAPNMGDFNRGFSDAEVKAKSLRSVTSAEFQQIAGIAQSAFTNVKSGIGTLSNVASEYEMAMTRISKTSGWSNTSKEYATFRKELEQLSTTLPVTYNELGQISEIGAQMGIHSTGGLKAFTQELGRLVLATDMTAEASAKSMGHFAGAYAHNLSSADGWVNQFGSALVALGNTTNSSESEIMKLGERLASAGKNVGMAESDILALSATLRSAGVSAEIGGSSMQRLMMSIQRAVSHGSEAVEDFAKVSGVSAEQFINTWKSRPIEAMKLLAKGISEYKDGAIAAIDEIGIKNSNDIRSVQVLANAWKNLETNISTSSNAWDNGLDDKLSASAKEVETFSNTFQAKMTILKNRLGIIWSNVGQGINQAILSFMKLIDPLINKFTEWSGKLVDSKGQATQLGQAVGALGLTFTGLVGGITAFASASYVFNVVGGMFSKFSSQVLGFKNTFGGLSASLANAGVSFNALFSVINIFVLAIIDAWNSSKLFRNSVRDLGEALVSIATSIISGMQPALTLLSILFTGIVKAISSVLIVVTPLISGIAQVISWFLQLNPVISNLVGSFFALQVGIPALIGVFKSLITVVTIASTRFLSLGKALIVSQFTKLRTAIMFGVGAIKLMNLEMLRSIGTLAIYVAKMVFWKSVQLAATAAQWLLNAAMYANPVTWLAAGVAALIAVIITFHEWLGKVTGVTKLLGKAFEWLGNVWKGVKSFFGFGDEAEEMKKDSEETSEAIDKMAESTQTSATEVANTEFENGSIQELGDSAREARYSMDELSNSVASSVSSYKSAEDGLNLSSNAVKNWQQTMSKTQEHYTTDLNIFTNRINDYFRRIPEGVKLGLDKGRLVVTGGLDGMSDDAKGKIAALIAMMNAEADANEFTFGEDIKLEGNRLVASLDATSQRAQEAVYRMYRGIQEKFSDSKFDGVTFAIDQFGNVILEGLEKVDAATQKEAKTMANNLQQMLSSNAPGIKAAIIDGINTPIASGIDKLAELKGQYSTQAGAIVNGVLEEITANFDAGTPRVKEAANGISRAIVDGAKPDIETVRQNTEKIIDTTVSTIISNKNLPADAAKLSAELTSQSFFKGTEFAKQAGEQKSVAFKDGIANGTSQAVGTSTQVKDNTINALSDGNGAAQQHGTNIADNYNTGIQTGGETAKSTAQNIGNQTLDNLKSPLQNPNSFIDILTGFNASLEQSNTILEAGGKGGGTHYITGFKQAIDEKSTSVFTGLTTEIDNFQTKINVMSTSAVASIQTLVTNISQAFSGMSTSINSTMSDISSLINTNINSIKVAIDGFASNVQSITTTIINSLQQMNHAISTSLSSSSQAFNSSGSQIEKRWNNCMTSMKNFTANGMSQMNTSLSNGANSSVNTVSQMSNSIVNTVNSMSSAMSSAGYNAGMGFYNGLASASGAIYALANEIASNVASTMRRALDIHSPSRVTRDIGGFAGQGLLLGLSKFIQPVKTAATRLSQAISDNIQSNTEVDLATVLPNVSDVNNLAKQTKQSLQSSYSIEASQNYEINHTTVVQFGNRAYRMIVEDITAEQKRIARLESI